VITNSVQSNWDRPVIGKMRYVRRYAAISSCAGAFSSTASGSAAAFTTCVTAIRPVGSHYSRKVHQAVVNEEEQLDPLPRTRNRDYATTYHAPVMAKECIDALLGISCGSEGKKKRKNKQSKLRKKDRKILMKENASATKGQQKQQQREQKQEQEHNGENVSELPTDRPPMLFVDGTLGGGGHSAALLDRLRPGDVVFGCDVDPSALSAATERLHRYTGAAQTSESSLVGTLPLFVPVQSNFRDLADVLPNIANPITGKRIMQLPLDVDVDANANSDAGTDTSDAQEEISFVGVDGMLLDLGISSHQIDTADRGFAFMKAGPLDMRMWGGDWSDIAESVTQITAGATPSISAADICNEFDVAELTRILRVYGDEPRARKIATAIVEARPLATTSDLVEAVSSVVPEFARKGRRMGRTATLARVFQSLRIVVNEEDEALVDVFEHSAPALVRPGGRLVVLSYHSMEDRATKRVIRDGSVRGTRGGAAIEKDIYGNIVGKRRPWKPLGKKRKADEKEVEVNSRARSATLRVGERQFSG